MVGKTHPPRTPCGSTDPVGPYISVVDGSLGPLRPGTVAVSREFAEWYGHRARSTVTYGLFGGRPVKARVVAVLEGGSAVPSLLRRAQHAPG